MITATALWEILDSRKPHAFFLHFITSNHISLRHFSRLIEIKANISYFVLEAVYFMPLV